jgi:hypothetical protein
MEMKDGIFAAGNPGLFPAGANSRQWAVATAAVLGGGLLIAGAVLPWFSLYAGLHAYPGIISMTGQVLAAGGAASVLAGVWVLLQGGHAVRWGLGMMGVGLLGFAIWLLVGLFELHGQLASNPMMVPKLEPGLFVATVGALLVALTLLFGRAQTHQE